MRELTQTGGMLRNCFKMDNRIQQLSAKLIAASYARKDGSHQIYLRIIIHRERWDIKTGIFIPIKKWNPNSESIKGNNPLVADQNRVLRALKTRALELETEFRLRNQYLTLEKFKNFWDNSDSLLSFYDYAQGKVIGRNDISENTRDHHKSVLRNLRIIQPTGEFAAINHQWLDQTRGALIKKGVSEPTINNSMKFIKTYLNMALKDGIAFNLDPKEIKSKSFKGTLVYLNENELKILKEYYFNPYCSIKHRRVLQCYLFSCFSGLRYSDIASLTRKSIHGKKITIIPQKTKRHYKSVTIPISDNLQNLMEPTGPIFEYVFSNAKMNIIIKEIAALVGIDKHLTFHSARHTFATMVLRKSKNVEMVRSLLGHSSLRETSIYLHVLDEDLKDTFDLIDQDI